MSAELAALGVELVSVPRFRRALDRYGSRLSERIFRPDELAYAARKRRPWHNLAARFAAKCAGRRALRSLYVSAAPIALIDLEVVRRRSGEPLLSWLSPLQPGAGPGAEDLRLLVSLTHDPEFALATVWVERVGRATLPP